MSKYKVNRKCLGGFPTVVKVIIKSPNPKGGYVCKNLLGYILVIFVLRTLL